MSTQLSNSKGVFEQGRQHLTHLLLDIERNESLFKELPAFITDADQKTFALFEDELWLCLYGGVGKHVKSRSHEYAVKAIRQLYETKPDYAKRDFSRFLDLFLFGMKGFERDKSWWCQGCDHDDYAIKTWEVVISNELCRCFARFLDIFPEQTSEHIEMIFTIISQALTTDRERTRFPEMHYPKHHMFDIFKQLLAKQPQALLQHQDQTVAMVDVFMARKRISRAEYFLLKPLYPELDANIGKGKKFGFLSGVNSDPVEDWRLFYREVFDLTLADSQFPSGLTAENPTGARLLIMAQSVDLELLVKVYAQHRIKLYENYFNPLDASMFVSKRTSRNLAYAVYLNFNQECDQETHGKSWTELKSENVEMITAEEWLVVRLKMMCEQRDFEEVGYQSKHSICGGTRLLDGQTCRIMPGYVGGCGNVLEIFKVPAEQRCSCWGSRRIYPAYTPDGAINPKWELLS
jgi:hypothetical protein